MREFKITYALTGTRIVNVFISDEHKLPADWADLPMWAQDEWLYARDHVKVDESEDIDYGKAVNIREVSHLQLAQ